MQEQNKCYMHCLNGGTCVTDVENEDHVFCHCPPEYYGSRCNLHYGGQDGRKYGNEEAEV